LKQEAAYEHGGVTFTSISRH